MADISQNRNRNSLWKKRIDMLYPYLLSNKRQSDTHNHVDESPEHYTERKKANLKRLYTACFHLYNIHEMTKL